MKKIALIFLIFLFCLPQISFANLSIDFWWVQRRTNENGTALNKAIFSTKDEFGNYHSENVLSEIKLYSPSGNLIQPTEATFGGLYETRSGRYDADNGQWLFDENPVEENWYYINFVGAMEIGNYRLSVKDNQGNPYEAFAFFNGVRSIPQIFSKTFCAFKDENGNLFWKWGIPSEKFPDISSSIRTWAAVYPPNGTNLDVYLKVPTHMGWAFIPNELLQELEQRDSNVKIGIQVRTNDNNNRNYSMEINWREANACGCDINSDQKTGLVEAIHSLQVVAGIR